MISAPRNRCIRSIRTRRRSKPSPGALGKPGFWPRAAEPRINASRSGTATTAPFCPAQTPTLKWRRWPGPKSTKSSFPPTDAPETRFACGNIRPWSRRPNCPVIRKESCSWAWTRTAPRWSRPAPMKPSGCGNVFRRIRSRRFIGAEELKACLRIYSPEEAFDKYCTEVFGSNGSLGDGHFVRYSRKSVTLDIFNVKFQFGDCQNVCYSRKSVISESGTSENLCTCFSVTR